MQRLYAHLLARLSPLPPLVERDNDLPPPTVLLATATQADASFGLAATLHLLMARSALSCIALPASDAP